MSLQDVFETFASFGSATKVKEMDNSHFAKMCKECGIVDKVFTTTDVDMLFTKVKAKGERKISFEQFTTGVIPEIARKKKLTEEEVQAQFTKSGVPQAHGTVAGANRFHDDKSQYTGVYKAGGPTNVDRDKGDLSTITDRDRPSDVRGAVAFDDTRGAQERKASTTVASEQKKSPPPAQAPAPAKGGASGASSLRDVFEKFASFGTGKATEMDNSHFAKLCKECGIVDKVFTTTDVDMLFTKVKAKGERKITFEQFETACIAGIAEKKKKTPAEIVAQLTNAGGPQAHGTVADANRFHDDKSQYTGVYKAGGPTNVDRDKGDLSTITDRDRPSDVRGAVQ